ncbi:MULTISPECIES: (R)-mandelonitrile lyase [Salipiger]|jgi:quercetin dioxygenase-like cupin family protein|uniref:(R)-mandelonitrile lyase n=1 Tax=Salipiger TaxID=263377 RepID=UPI001A8FCD9A|nr:cupin domain-containing protein [Salipiger bermudensis]MBN9675639.1 cupin domain-containing protein [Salipiger bermudensis]MCA1283785.1 cupin domain-containing protein [Salipiger bermudensis]
MLIKENGSQPSSLGPESNFTGHARRDPIHVADDPSRLAVGAVTFDPGARTVWHTHPVGQLLVITAGAGRVGTWGGEVREVRAGDTVWFEAGEKHWHGAGASTAMTHIAITEAVDGSAVDWLEPVSDADFDTA